MSSEAPTNADSTEPHIRVEHVVQRFGDVLALDAATLDAIFDRFHADLDHALNYAFFE